MITIIGAGKVGGDAALFSALRRLDDEIMVYVSQLYCQFLDVSVTLTQLSLRLTQVMN